MKYGIYFAYWEKEWNVDQKKYISKVKDLGFDILEISCAMLKNISKDELLEMKKMAEDAGVMLTAGYGPNAGENLGSSDPAVVKNAIALYRYSEETGDSGYSYDWRGYLFLLAGGLFEAYR